MALDLIFHPNGDKIWTTTLNNETISINILRDIVKIFAAKEESFDDLHEALQYIVDTTGQRPLFRTDDITANARTTC